MRSERTASRPLQRLPAATAVATRIAYHGSRPAVSTLRVVIAAVLGLWDIVIIVAVLVLVFGTARFGRAFRSLKTGGRELKRGWRGEDELPPPDELERDG